MSNKKQIVFLRTHPSLSPETRDRAHDLRLHQTRQEWALWRMLRGDKTDVKFRRQQPIGPYIADFYCSALKLVIEADGGQHSDDADKDRDVYMRDHGLTVLRFWNNDIDKNIDGVFAAIQSTIQKLQKVVPVEK